MRKAINTLVVADLAFLFLHAVSGMVDGCFSDLLYLLAFFLPVALALIVCRGGAKPTLCIKRRDLVLVLPLIPVTIISVMGISTATSALIGAFGIENEVLLEGGIFEAVLRYALATAVLEELTFRYLPMRLLAEKSSRAAVLISSVFFALVHCDLFQMPYAFFAGVVFMVLDIATNSILTSLFIHFLNNLLAVIFYFYADATAIRLSLILPLSLFAMVGAAVILVRRREYSSLFGAAFSRGDFSPTDASTALCLAIPTITVAIMSLC